MVVGVAKWLQDWSNIRMEQCERVGVLPRKKESVRPEGEREQGTYAAKGLPCPAYIRCHETVVLP